MPGAALLPRGVHGVLPPGRLRGPAGRDRRYSADRPQCLEELGVLRLQGAVQRHPVALVLPQIVYGMLYFLLSWGPDVVPWLDLSFAVAAFRGQLPDVPSGAPDLGVGPILVTFVLWVVLPFVVGGRRILRTELK